MKIYTKQGDSGLTGTLMPGKISKDDPRIEVIGQTDTLNSCLGLIVAHLPYAHSAAHKEKTQSVYDELIWVQSSLFDIGALLAQDLQKVNADWIDQATAKLESSIDLMTEQLPPLKEFILPGGSSASAFAHNARSLCRNLERRMITFRGEEPHFPPKILAYINRLSDYIFTLARYLNLLQGIEDIKWRSINKN